MPALAAAAADELERFRGRVSRLPYERKGVLYSEMFFLYLCARAVGPARILESGRARAQSTLLLATLFPELPIVSYEHDPASPDVAIAAARLEPCRNVELRFGDATRELPAIARPGDVALIDGPKGFRALRLALRLLAQGRVAMVFLHDMLPGTPERAFLEKRLPLTVYSDDPRFVGIARTLDSSVQDIPDRPGYGYSLACLQHRAGSGYRRAWAAAAFAGLASRAGG